MEKTVSRFKRDPHNLGTLGLYFGILLTQLRQMLSSRDSSEMPQEDQQHLASS